MTKQSADKLPYLSMCVANGISVVSVSQLVSK